jgi:probable addiction module antidote protein
MALETQPFDAADYLSDDESIVFFLDDALQEGDPQEIARSLRTVVRARGGAEKVALESGTPIAQLQHALDAESGDLTSFFIVLRALRLKVQLGSIHSSSVAA